NYKTKLDALDAKIRSGMSACEKKDVLITHATLGYFCREYGCNQVAITGINPEAEPSASELAAIITQARERNVSAVFFESLIDPRSAQTISQEIGGYALVFNSVHGLTPDENARGGNYITLMEENLANLKKGLACR
ncbi:MAG: zinc ABC transporter substrate-binding protein, partial [Candidatus Micrarchaeia archaeon]